MRPCTLGGLDTKSALELLARYTGSVRITVDPRAAEGLVEECGGQPAALVLAGGWLAARPKAAVADLAKQLRDRRLTKDRRSTSSPASSGSSYAALPRPPRGYCDCSRSPPRGLVDPHTASALAGCSVGAARTTLDDFAGLGLVRGRRVAAAAVRGARLPAAAAALRSPRPRTARPRSSWPAPGCWSGPYGCCVSCRAITETDSSPAREKLAGMPRALRFPNPRAAADWLRIRQPALLAAARLAVADGELDTLARRLMAALVRALVAHLGTQAAAPELYGIHRLVLDVAERRDLPREKAAALLNLADLDAQTGRTEEALARYRAALDAGREANDPYATGRAMESVGGAHQELGDYDRAADWYGRALAQRLARGERADAARLHGRIATAHTYAGRYGEALRNWRSAVAGVPQDRRCGRARHGR